MNKIGDRRSIIITAIVNLGLIAYLGLILLFLRRDIGKDDEYKSYHQISVVLTNEIIDEYSSLDSDNNFICYKDIEISESRSDQVIFIFSSSGDNASIGTYNPYTYIYGSEDKDLSIFIKLKDSKSYKIRYDFIYVSDIDGNNYRKLYYSEYALSNYKVTYSKDEPKYIYGVELTVFVK